MKPVLIVLFLIVTSVTSQTTEKHQECGANEEFNSCGSLCVSTCNSRQFANCGQGCNIRQCFCKDGYIRSALDGPCVKVSECRFYMGENLNKLEHPNDLSSRTS